MQQPIKAKKRASEYELEGEEGGIESVPRTAVPRRYSFAARSSDETTRTPAPSNRRPQSRASRVDVGDRAPARGALRPSNQALRPLERDPEQPKPETARTLAAQSSDSPRCAPRPVTVPRISPAAQTPAVLSLGTASTSDSEEESDTRDDTQCPRTAGSWPTDACSCDETLPTASAHGRTALARDEQQSHAASDQRGLPQAPGRSPPDRHGSAKRNSRRPV